MIILTDQQLIEGIVGSISFVFLTLIIKHLLDHTNIYLVSSIAWFGVWLARKTAVSLYERIRKYYNYRSFNISIPFPFFVSSSK